MCDSTPHAVEPRSSSVTTPPLFQAGVAPPSSKRTRCSRSRACSRVPTCSKPLSSAARPRRTRHLPTRCAGASCSGATRRARLACSPRWQNTVLWPRRRHLQRTMRHLPLPATARALAEAVGCHLLSPYQGRRARTAAAEPPSHPRRQALRLGCARQQPRQCFPQAGA